jgi:hypothetical protein
MLICVRRFYSLWCAAQWGVPKGRKSEPVVFPQRDPAPVEKENARRQDSVVLCEFIIVADVSADTQRCAGYKRSEVHYEIFLKAI